MWKELLLLLAVSVFPLGRAMSIPGPLDTFTSGLASVFRLPSGVTVDGYATSSKLEDVGQGQSFPVLKRLYDVENSRACRHVRERITELDVSVEHVIPSASNSRVFTDANYAYALPLSTIIPRLVVMEADKGEQVLSGEEEILSYLAQTFAAKVQLTAVDDGPREQAVHILREIGSYAAGVMRVGRGCMVVGAAGDSAPRPSTPLILYSYEGNQFCRLVREVLTELDIVYELRSAGKGSPRRAELASLTGGKTQCPYLIDPNTGTSMFESADIIRYLYKTYALYTPPNELLEWASDTVLSAAKPILHAIAPVQAGSQGDDPLEYQRLLEEAKTLIRSQISESQVVVFSYKLSPFCTETKSVLNNLGVSFKEVSLGLEWIPGLIADRGAITRAALLEMTGQSSLPHTFVGGQSIGGLFSGTPGLLKAIESGKFQELSSISIPSLKVEESEALA